MYAAVFGILSYEALDLFSGFLYWSPVLSEQYKFLNGTYTAHLTGSEPPHGLTSTGLIVFQYCHKYITKS